MASFTQTLRSYVRSLPTWYLVAVAILLGVYLFGWAHTMQVAEEQRARGETIIQPVVPTDSHEYAKLSDSLLEGRFSTPSAEFEYFHTPGYPVFVAGIRTATGGSFFAVTLVQIVLTLAVVFMTREIGKVLVSSRVGEAASLLLFASPIVWQMSLHIMTDVLFMFLLTAGFLIILKKFIHAPYQTIVAAGALFAAAVYVRPVGFLAFPIFVAPLLAAHGTWKKKIVLAVAMLGIVTLLAVPWMARNWVQSGQFAFSSIVQFNFAYYYLPHFWSWKEGTSIDEGIERVERLSGVERGTDAEGHPANWANLAYAPELKRFIMPELLSAPLSYGFWHLYNSAGFFLDISVKPPPKYNLKKLLAEGRIAELVRAVSDPWWALAMRLGLLLGWCLFALGVWHLRRSLIVWAFVCIVIYLAALSGPSAQARYRMPVQPIISVLVAVGGLYTLERLRLTKV